MTIGAEQLLPGLTGELLAQVRSAAGDREPWLVGGFVRDRLMQRPPRDVDLAVADDPRRFANRLARLLEADAFPLSTEHGAWRLTLPHERDGITHIDITALRGSLGDDLGERDFTINAIALPLAGGVPHDPFAGIDDIRRRQIRLVSDGAIRADPVRALRAVRFAAEFTFSIDERSINVIMRDAALLSSTAGERQRDEIMRAFDTAGAMASVRLMDSLGLLSIVLPELDAARDCDQPKEHYWNVFDHSVQTVSVLDCILAPALDRPDRRCGWRRAVLAKHWPCGYGDRWNEQLSEGRSRRAVLKLIGLLHDVAKPETRTFEDNGRMRFFGHPDRGAEIATTIFQRLRFSAREVRLASTLIREHLRPGQLAALGQEPSARALFRLHRDLGDDLTDLLALNLADGAAAAGPRQTAAQWEAHVAYAGWILSQYTDRPMLAKPPRLITGHDLIAELGMTPGPRIGRVLDALTEATVAGEITTRDQAIAHARRMIEAGS